MATLPRRTAAPLLVLRRPWFWRRLARREARCDGECRHSLPLLTGFRAGLVAAFRYSQASYLERRVRDSGELQKNIAEADQRLKGLEDAREREADKLEPLQAQLSKAEDPGFLGRLSGLPYWLLLALLGVVEFPLLRVLLTRVPLSDFGRDGLALLVGLASIAGLHLLAPSVLVVRKPEGEGIEGRRRFFFHACLLAAGLLFSLALGIGLAIVRGSEIEDLSKRFAGGITAPDALAVALAGLWFFVLVAALALAVAHAEGDQWRRRAAAVADQEEAVDEIDEQLTELRVERARLLVEELRGTELPGLGGLCPQTVIRK